MDFRLKVWLAGVVLIIAGFWPAQIAKAAESNVLVDYSEGLENLAQGQWDGAEKAFQRARNAAPDDRRFALAHAVALGLGEKCAEAVGELSKMPAPRGRRDREPEFWTYVFETMGGFATPAHRIGGARFGESNSQLLQNEAVSMPAHMVLGGDDYPTDFASFVYYEMALNGYGHPRESLQKPDSAQNGRMRVKAGRWFSARFQASADLAPAHLQRAKQLNTERKFVESLRELQYARIAYPENRTVAFYVADNWLGLGRPGSARREFTYTLTGQSSWAIGYLERAVADARMGDANRAQADFAIAAELDPKETDRWRERVQQALKNTAAKGEPLALLAGLEQAARSSGTSTLSPQFVTQSQVFQRVAGMARKRYDEDYQDNVRKLEGTIKAKPKSADARVELATYLIDESRVSRRSEAVEPRRALEPYRQRPNETEELKRALVLCDEALQLDAKSIRARMEKAAALARFDRDDEAEKLVDEVLALAPKNPEALRLRARYYTDRANNLSLQGAGLRTSRSSSSSHTENRSDGVYEVTTTTYYPPSDADLSRANSLDQAANDLYRRADAAISAALAATKGTFEGELLLADSQFGRGDRSGAEATLRKAIATRPKSLEAREALIDLYLKTGRGDDADLERSSATALFQTSAGWTLKQAWKKIVNREFGAAKELLTRARQLDPQDARVPAYRGIIAQADGHPDEAKAQFALALLLEEGRLAVNEPPVYVGEMPEHEAQDFGLAMRLRELLAESSSANDAVALLARNTAVARFLGAGGRATQMFTAMLPEPGAPAIPVPAPVNMATLLANSHVAAGKALQKLGRENEAQAQFTAALAYGPKAGVPNIGGRNGSNYAGNAGGNTAEAYMELAKQAIRRKDFQAAANYMSQAANLRIPRERLQEANQIQMEIARGMR